MSTCFFFDSALPVDQTKELLSQARERHRDILRHFWISDVGDARPHNIENDSEYGFVPKCTFLIEWDKECSELLELIPAIFYEAFGKENILVRDNNYDVVPPP